MPLSLTQFNVIIRQSAYRAAACLRDGAAVLGTEFLDRVLCGICTLFSIFQFCLYFTVFGQVDGGNFLLQNEKDLDTV